MKKFEEISLLRVVATIMVVFTHSYYVFTYGPLCDFETSELNVARYIIKNVIVKFNMPIFMWISGFLFAWSYYFHRKYHDWTNLVKSKGKRLLFPYLVFAPLVLLSLGKIADLNQYTLLYPIGHLWFLMVLIEAFIIGWVIIRFVNKANMIILLMLFVVISIKPILLGGGNMLAYNDLCKYFVFFFLGILMGRFMPIYEYICRTSMIIYSLVVFIVMLWAYDYVMGIGRYGYAIIFDRVAGLSGIAFFISLCANAKTVVMNKYQRILTSLDTNGMGIYIIHSIIVNILIANVLVLEMIKKSPNWYCLLMFIFIISSSWLLAYMMNNSRIGRVLLGSK